MSAFLIVGNILFLIYVSDKPATFIELTKNTPKRRVSPEISKEQGRKD
jgi:hypothetical protein